MPEPPGTDRCIYFCRIPYQLICIGKCLPAAQILIAYIYPSAKFRVVFLLTFLCYLFAVSGAKRNNTPFGFTRMSCFIAAPSDIRSANRNACIRLKPADQRVIPFPIIILFFSIWAFPAGPIKPYRKDFTISGKQFRQLADKKIIIFFSPSI